MLKDILDWVVLAAAALSAVAVICDKIGKPFLFVKKKTEEKVDSQIEHRIEAHDTELIQQVTDLIDKNVTQRFDSIDIQLKSMDTAINLVINSNTDLLRAQILDIYDKYKFNKKIPEHDWDRVNQFYKDYASEGGNGFVERRFHQMETWEIIPDDD